MTDHQRKAVRRIQAIIKESFRRGMLAVVYQGTDTKLHVQVVNNCQSKVESLDLANRALAEVQRAEGGIITALSESEKRIIT